MSVVYLLVEGQTEEQFVKHVLVEHYAQQGLYLTPIIAETSPRHRGGVKSYLSVKRQIERLCKQRADVKVTTIFDLYALPNSFPGKEDPAYTAIQVGKSKAEYLEAKMAHDINMRNFIPHFLVHEFEALLLADLDKFEKWMDVRQMREALRSSIGATAPEDVNDNPHTAPSKRILAVWPNYDKIGNGIAIAKTIGLSAMREACPHFHDWLDKMDALIPRE